MGNIGSHVDLTSGLAGHQAKLGTLHVLKFGSLGRVRQQDICRAKPRGTKAKQTGATVTFIEDAALLELIGGVAAFLRWRG
jgi:hypothetical protein